MNGMVGGVQMLKVVSNCWALFLGLALIMLGNGLQGSLLGLRASIEGFGISVTGLVMSGYFIGMIVGSTLVPKIVSRVGHIRTFGALASLASTSILVHLAFADPWVWWAMRIVTGIAYAGLYIVAESWLNDFSENETRGQLLSFYMLTLLGGMAGGQFMLNIASPEGFQLFILISVLVSIAVIPILTSVSSAPAFETVESVSTLQLYKVSPLGVFGMFASGIATGSIFGLGVIYASSVGLSVKEVSFFMGSLIIGGVVLQYPIGWLSDRLGRRKIIIMTCALGATSSFVASTLLLDNWIAYAVIALVGGLCLPLYSLCAAHTNDYLNPSQMVAASGTLVLVNGLGATIGAPLTAFIMEFFGPQGFYQVIGGAFLLICTFALWRSTQREAMAREDQGDFVAMAPSPISAAFNADVELEDIEAASDVDKEGVIASFEELVEDLSTDTESE
jgi:MFS family permease